MRIIAGAWKRTPLPVPDSPGLRPSTDRVRETVFNWLAFLIGDFSQLDVLDMFAGTGALGFEAASRGARSVVMTEKSRTVAMSLRRTCEKLSASQIEVLIGDGIAQAQRSPRRYGLVFLDPPFALGLHARALETALAVLVPGGLVYYESNEPLTPEGAQQAGVRIVRSSKAGQVWYALLSPNSAGTPLAAQEAL